MISQTIVTRAEFWDHVNTLAASFHGSITSGIRTLARNRTLDGAENSFHLLGLAADVVLDDPALTPTFIAMAKRLGIHVIDEGDHLHLQPTKGKL